MAMNFIICQGCSKNILFSIKNALYESHDLLSTLLQRHTQTHTGLNLNVQCAAALTSSWRRVPLQLL